jgi:hypothetical protein
MKTSYCTLHKVSSKWSQQEGRDVGHMMKTRNAYKILIKNLKGINYSEDNTKVGNTEKGCKAGSCKHGDEP